MALAVKTGTYYAGINRPFFVSDSMIRSKLAEMGAQLVAIYDRSKTPLPATVDPRAKDPRYQDDWDEWMIVNWSGPPKTLDVKRVWKWLLVSPLKPATSQPLASSSKGGGSLAPMAFAGLGVLTLLKVFK